MIGCLVLQWLLLVLLLGPTMINIQVWNVHTWRLLVLLQLLVIDVSLVLYSRGLSTIIVRC